MLARQYEAGQSSDLSLGYRCFTFDTIMQISFAFNWHTVEQPDFDAPILRAMMSSLPAAVVFKHFSAFKRILLSLPRWLSVKINPTIAPLMDLQQVRSLGFVTKPGC